MSFITMDPSFSEFPNFNDQTLLPDMLNEHPSGDPFEYFSYLDQNPINSAQSSTFNRAGDAGEFSDGVLKYINQVLMEEDMESKPSMFYDPLTLQATEESLNEVIGGGNNSTSQHQNPLCVDQNVHGNGNDMMGSYGSELLYHDVISQNELLLQYNRGAEEGWKFLPRDQLLSAEGNKPYTVADRKAGDAVVIKKKNGIEDLHVRSRGTKNYKREQMDLKDGRSNKQSAYSKDDEEGELSEFLQKVLLGKAMESQDDQVSQNGANNGLQQIVDNGKARRKNQHNEKEVIDLRALLILCANAVSVDDRVTASELLKQIRQHSPPFGDYYQRLAHHFANALEVRLAGTGSQVYTALSSKQVPATDTLDYFSKSAAYTLKFYRPYLAACPFMKMSMIFANHMILKGAEKAETLHIIDFGILYGFQWPALIHSLSRRPGGPPKLRITGVDFPSRSYRPEERVQETRHRLAMYCKRFNVPFEYHAIAQKWETIQLDDLKVQRNEVLAVNCLCRLKYLYDETVMLNSPRDTVLSLIRKLNPDLFILSVLNGSHHAPFFVQRFREALFHYSAFFDILDATLHYKDQMRLEFEKEYLGREILNIVACEGLERIVRPETYKQWQIRNMKAGFRQLPLDGEVMNKIKAEVKMGYRPDFVVDEDSNWMLQGWKGKILFASTCLAPSRT